jgi:hypothetical protein
MNKSDVKTVEFGEEFDMECTYFIKEGVPEDKTMNFIIMQVMPDGKNPIIFEKEVNLTMHFGPQYSQHTILLDGNRSTP